MSATAGPGVRATNGQHKGASAGEPSRTADPEGRVSYSPAQVIEAWRAEGPLIDEPTGLVEIDDFTSGGPTYGSRWYLAGAPDAGKTALLLQIAHTYADRGVMVGLLGVDEEVGDLVTRLAQRIGYSRRSCEIRDPAVLVQMEGLFGALPIQLYDGDWTIEAAAFDLATLARARAQHDPAGHPHGPRAMLGIDSIQTVECAADIIAHAAGRDLPEVTSVTARVRAVRSVATRHRMITLSTTELSRGAYRSSDPTQQTSTMAAGKWSGAIEYSARVLLGLRSVAGESDLIEVEYAKNKQWPSDRPRPDASFRSHFRLDRASQTIWPVRYDAPPAATSADRDAKARDKVSTDTIAVARVLFAWPGLTVREFRSKVKAKAGVPHGRVDVALDELGKAVVRGNGPNRATPLSLDLGELSDGVRRAVEGSK